MGRNNRTLYEICGKKKIIYLILKHDISYIYFLKYHHFDIVLLECFNLIVFLKSLRE